MLPGLDVQSPSQGLCPASRRSTPGAAAPLPFFAGPAFGTLRSWASKIVLVFARLAQSVEHETLNLRVVGSSPRLSPAFAKLE